MFETIVKLTEKQIDEIIVEQKRIKDLIHNTKNQLLDIEIYLDQKAYDKAKLTVQTCMLEFSEINIVSLCTNVYIDAVLRQKIAYYKDVQFDLTLHVQEHIPIDSKDLIILLTFLIDSTCPFLSNNLLALHIVANQHEMSIKLNARIYEHRSIFHNHIIAYSQIRKIIEKYHGDIQVNKEADFQCMILLLF